MDDHKNIKSILFQVIVKHKVYFGSHRGIKENIRILNNFFSVTQDLSPITTKQHLIFSVACDILPCIYILKDIKVIYRTISGGGFCYLKTQTDIFSDSLSWCTSSCFDVDGTE